MDKSGLNWIDRRSFLGAVGLGMLPAVVSAAGGADPEPDDPVDLKDPWMLDPEKSFLNFVRSQGDLSGAIVPQWWRGAYLAIYRDRQPELLFRMEGCEMKRTVPLGNGEFQFQYRIFTSIRHPETNAPLNGQQWRNPITVEQVEVEPNRSQAERIVKLTDRGIVEVSPSSGFEAVIHLLWTAQGPYVMANGYKDRPKDRPIPIKEFATTFLDREAAADFSAPRLENRFNSTFVAPFQRWMNMPADAGIAVWHASGHKARDVESLPADYLEEMFRYRPEMRDWIGQGGRGSS